MCGEIAAIISVLESAEIAYALMQAEVFAPFAHPEGGGEGVRAQSCSRNQQLLHMPTQEVEGEEEGQSCSWNQQLL